MLIIYPDIDSSKKVRITSDIHLGHKKADVHDVNELRPLLEGCDYFICNGDLAELREGHYKASGEAMLEELYELVESLPIEFLYIGGNHDPKIPTRACFLRGRDIFITHGDIVFRTGAPWGREYLQNKPMIKEVLAKYDFNAMNLEQRLEQSAQIAQLVPAVLSPEYTSSPLINFFLHAAWPPDRPFRIIGAWMFYKYLIRRLARHVAPESRVIITGHFHRPTVFRADGKLFINTGAHFKHAHAWTVDIQGEEIIISRVERLAFPPAPLFRIRLDDPNLRIKRVRR